MSLRMLLGPRRGGRARRRAVRLGVEALEGRRLLATFTVTNTDDEGPGSLRAAILLANDTPGPDTIDFAIGAGPQTISPLSALPAIDEAVAIDGTTQPGFFSGSSLIELDGVEAGEADGLTIRGEGSVVRGLSIGRFSGSRIVLEEGGGNVVVDNIIGASVLGSLNQGNSGDGVLVRDSAANRIERNTLANNRGAGLRIVGAGAAGNLVLGNVIGIDVTRPFFSAYERQANRAGGVSIEDAPQTTIGGTTPAESNFIAGNQRDGVNIQGTGAAGTLVRGNHIGIDPEGLALGNVFSGVTIIGTPAVTIGGTTPGAGNFISGNGSSGILIISEGASGILIQGNSIGLTTFLGFT